MARPGEYFLVAYDVGGPPLYHERLCTAVAPAGNGLLAVVTPDDDHYVEQYVLTNPDLFDIRFLGLPGGTPEGIQPDRIYRFRDVPRGARLHQLLRDGAMLVGAPPPPPIPALRGAGPGGEAAGVAPAAAARAARRAPEGYVWVAVEDAVGLKRGQEIEDLGPDALILGDVCVFRTELGAGCARQITRAEMESFAHDDLRVLPVKYDNQGRRRRAYNECVDLINDEEPEGGLEVQGGRVVAWALREWRDHGLTPITHHDAWVRSSGVAKSDRSVHEHNILSRIVHAALCTDQLNLPACLWGELALRRIMLIEDAHRTNASQPDYSAAEFYLGQASTASITVSPDLRRHVAAELKREAEVSKEARKAREEAKLGRQKGKDNPSAAPAP
mmetsp:Transcript_74297/g.177015  ORF Transcript_74297/g.177015 Transcript_74297/m.177015 type:complete len:387 (-) Transcript_74297:3566-4726(-)